MSEPVICSVMYSATRPYYHLRRKPKGGRMAAQPNTFCGLPVEQDYRFGLRAWGQPEMGTWCEECWRIYVHGALGVPADIIGQEAEPSPLAAQFLEVLNVVGSEDETNLDPDRRDHYKPLYRASATLVAHSSPFWQKHLEGHTLALNDAKVLLRCADPYYIKALSEDEETFDRLYLDMVDTWKETDDD